MSTLKKLPRRIFLQRAGTTAASVLLPSTRIEALFSGMDSIPETVLPPRTVLSPVGYSAVTLAGGIAEQQRANTMAVLLTLSDDELLKPFRERSGKPAPGKAIGGWYDADAYCPGHTFGQWLSAFARTYAITGKEATQARVNTLVAGLNDSFDAKGSFFAEDNRFPAYTLEKLNCGLIDSMAFAKSGEAATALRHINELAQRHLPEKALSRAEQRKRTNKDDTYTYDETYTLPENYFLAYQRSGDSYYRDLAIKFMHTSFLDPLARGENVIPGLHAYSHLNALNSAAQAYLVVGNKDALAAATNGFGFVQQQSYASGGWGPNEAFVTPGKGQLSQSLRGTHSSFETPCGAYGHFKITRALLSITGDAKYGDSMEAVMLNTVLGSLPLLADGSSFYYSDYNLQAKKIYYDSKWPCCSGTLAQAASDYRINAYLLGVRGMHVNLYTPSTLRYEDRGIAIELEQGGTYPLGGNVDFFVRPSRSARFALSFRIPAWAGDGTRLSINGKSMTLPTPVLGFSTVERRWHRNDRITLQIPMPLRLQTIEPETPGIVALLYGPLLLYGLGPSAAIEENALLGAERSSDRTWIVKTATGDRTFTTFDRITDQSYSAYHSLV